MLDRYLGALLGPPRLALADPLSSYSPGQRYWSALTGRPLMPRLAAAAQPAAVAAPGAVPLPARVARSARAAWLWVTSGVAAVGAAAGGLTLALTTTVVTSGAAVSTVFLASLTPAFGAAAVTLGGVPVGPVPIGASEFQHAITLACAAPGQQPVTYLSSGFRVFSATAGIPANESLPAGAEILLTITSGHGTPLTAPIAVRQESIVPVRVQLRGAAALSLSCSVHGTAAGGPVSGAGVILGSARLGR